MRWPFINKARVLKKWLNSNSWLFHWCHTKTWSLNLDWMYTENHILFCIFLSNIWYTYLFDALRLCWECVKRRRGWGQCRLWDMEYCLQYEKINLCLVRSITKLLTNSIWPYIIRSQNLNWWQFCSQCPWYFLTNTETLAMDLKICKEDTIVV